MLMNKKILLNFMTGACMLLSLTSCPSDDGENDGGNASVQLQVSPSSVILNEQNTGTVTITSNTSWSVYCPDSWMNVSPSEGTGNQTLTISATGDNSGSTARTGTLIIRDKGGKVSASVSVTQNPPPINYYLRINKTDFNFQSEGGEDKCIITTNETWMVTGANDWCSATPTNGEEGSVQITIMATENTSLIERSITLLVTGKNSGSQQQLTVNQKGATPYLNIDKNELTYSDDGGSESFSISSNDKWSITGTSTWCTISASDGAEGTTTITVKADANTSYNERSTTLIIKGKNSNIERKVNIIQSGVSDPSDIGRNDYDNDIELGSYALSVSPTSLSFSAEGESKTLSITGNDSWSTSSSQTWCKLSTTSGSGNSSITVTANKNSTSSSRTATIKITPAHANSITISVTQAKPTEEDSSVGRNDYDSDEDLNNK